MEYNMSDKEIRETFKRCQEQSIKRFREKFPELVQDSKELPSDGAIFEVMEQVPQDVAESFGINAEKKN